MMEYPKISVVTPSYNQGQYIEQTIQSVLNQGYPNLEYIIIDGGSTDNTVEIIRKYEANISYWISEPDRGQTDAINKGFAKCTGEIFNWINSDDYYEPGSFFKLASFFSNPQVNVVCGKEWGFNNDNPENKLLHPGSMIRKNVFDTIRVGIIDQPCTFFRKNKIDSFFPLDPSLRYVMDRQLWWSYLLRYGQEEILQTNDIFTWFRLHSESKSVGEADLFEAEFDRLKLSLLNQLQAPDIVKNQVAQVQALSASWNIKITPESLITASFASYYAERNYINNNTHAAGKLMKIVKKIKGAGMSSGEWKLWIACCMLPPAILRSIKRIKNGRSSE